MPEGHTIHRLAADHRARFGGRLVTAVSPQGRFADSAALVSGQELTAAEAHGKHLFLGFGPPGGTRWVHIHLGLYGKVTFGTGPAPAPTGQIRLRLTTDGVAGPDGLTGQAGWFGPSGGDGHDGSGGVTGATDALGVGERLDGAHWADLRGPTTCALLTRGEKQDLHQRLGPDPLRQDADPALAFARISRSASSLAVLLLDQKILAGVGNVYRAEVLFRHGIDPFRAGRDLGRAEWDALWADLTDLLRAGVRANRIDTVRPEHSPRATGRPPRVDDHGGEVYVYRRAGQGCHVCGEAVHTTTLLGRNLFWCPTCQPRHG